MNLSHFENESTFKKNHILKMKAHSETLFENESICERSKDTVNDTHFRKLPCTISINVHDRDSLGKGKLQKHTGLMGKISFRANLESSKITLADFLIPFPFKITPLL